MRTYGRVYTNPERTAWNWVEVNTNAEGFDDYVWITTLVQCLKLNLNESPFYATYGLPAHQAIIQQVAPDYYMMVTQQRFSQYFASLVISRVPDAREPTYNVNLTTQQGVKVAENIPI